MSCDDQETFSVIFIFLSGFGRGQWGRTFCHISLHVLYSTVKILYSYIFSFDICQSTRVIRENFIIPYYLLLDFFDIAYNLTMFLPIVCFHTIINIIKIRCRCRQRFKEKPQMHCAHLLKIGNGKLQASSAISFEPSLTLGSNGCANGLGKIYTTYSPPPPPPPPSLGPSLY
jgi:hypothetical protein